MASCCKETEVFAYMHLDLRRRRRSLNSVAWAVVSDRSDICRFFKPKVSTK